MDRKKVTIIIPAYNEEKRIGKTLKAYSEYFENLRKKRTLDYEILVVINATTDKTEKIVKRFRKDSKYICYLNLIRGGKGYAIIEGFKDASRRNPDLIGFVDADMATSPDALYDIIKNIEDYDGIIASRYIKGVVVNPKPSIQRVIVSRIFNFFIRSLFFMPYSDTQCGAKVFRKSVLNKIIGKLTITMYAFDVDLLYQLEKSGFKIREFPTVWSDKSYSKVNFLKAGPLMALAVIRLRILNSPMKRFITLYDRIVRIIK